MARKQPALILKAKRPNGSVQAGAATLTLAEHFRRDGTPCCSHADGLDRFKFHVITTPPRPSVFGTYSAANR